MNIDREMISELIGAAFAEGLQEGRVPTIELLSQAAFGAQTPKTDPMQLNKYSDKGLMYKGKDEHDYLTSRDLFEANQRWMVVNYPKLGINSWRGIDY